MNGILIVNKPEGLTSRDVVNKVSKVLGTKKIGHTGTLDPLATGVLVLTIGKCTKLSEMLTSTFKKYHVEFVLGYETDTLDVTGKKIKESNKEVSQLEIEEVILSFIGSYDQEVPKYSAVKVDGRRLYDYARNDIEVFLPKRLVEIQHVQNIVFKESAISFDVTVSKGTYIRSLIRDIGEKLGTYATMTSLTRTKQGNFDISDSVILDDVLDNKYTLITPEEFLKDMYKIELESDDELLKKVKNGVALSYNLDEPYIGFTQNNKFLCIYEKKDDKFRMFVMF